MAIAIELIEEGSVACGNMVSTLFFPPLPFVLQVSCTLQLDTEPCFLPALSTPLPVTHWAAGSSPGLGIYSWCLSTDLLPERIQVLTLSPPLAPCPPHLQGGDGAPGHEGAVRGDRLLQPRHQLLLQAGGGLHGNNLSSSPVVILL